MFALLLAAGCSDSFENFQGDLERLVASPSQLFLQVGETKTVEVSGVDAQGNPLTFNYEVTSSGAGINVRRDSTFLPEYVDDTTLQVPAEGERFRFIVEGTAYGPSQFVVSAGGQEITIPVQVVPQNTIEAQISNVTPGFNEEIVITAPSGTRFTDSSEVTLPGGPTQPITVGVAADGTTITAILPPNVATSPTITNVETTAAPGIVFSPATSQAVTTPVVDSLVSTLSSLTPDGGSAVTLTSNDPQFTFSPSTIVVVGSDSAVTTSVAPDGSSVTFLATPGVTGNLFVNNLVTGPFLIGLPSKAGTITVGTDVAPIAGTDDPATAPTIATPAGPGIYTGIVDDGSTPGYASCGDVGLPCQVYRFEVPVDGSYDFDAVWQGTSDVGIYFLASDGTTLTGNTDCDALGNTGAGQPEHCTQELTAGTYYVAFVPFGPFYPTPEPNPEWLKIRVTPHVE